jgi:hypothetical protein
MKPHRVARNADEIETLASGDYAPKHGEEL